jgi:hypothetical protein
MLECYNIVNSNSNHHHYYYYVNVLFRCIISMYYFDVLFRCIILLRPMDVPYEQLKVTSTLYPLPSILYTLLLLV